MSISEMVLTELAKEEFLGLKLLIARMFKGNTYLSLPENHTDQCASFYSWRFDIWISISMWTLTSKTTLTDVHPNENVFECVLYIIFQHILHFVHILLVLPGSSAVCERGFSSLKRIKSVARASLHTDTVEDLIRISVEGPSLEDSDARESVASWFSQGQRARSPNYRCWTSKGHVTANVDLLIRLWYMKLGLSSVKLLKQRCFIYNYFILLEMVNFSWVKHFKHFIIFFTLFLLKNHSNY